MRNLLEIRKLLEDCRSIFDITQDGDDFMFIDQRFYNLDDLEKHVVWFIEKAKTEGESVTCGRCGNEVPYNHFHRCTGGEG